MKLFLLTALVALALSGPAIVRDPSSPILTQEDIDFINQNQDSWTASLDWVGSMTYEEAQKYASTEIKPREFPEYNWGAILDNFQAPASFDSRNQWPSCIHPILNQEQCGSCWAFGATEALSDRLCIGSKGSINVVLSPQYLVDCDHLNLGCNGGNPDLAWSFMKSKGVPAYSCVSYTGANGKCPSTCDDGSEFQFYKAASVNTYSGPSSIQAAILAGGPVETGFSVYQDFMSYSGGIYKHTTGDYLGGHAVKIIGWGNQNGTNYWICANSWGTSWGLQGFFWIAFGQCGIDSQAVAGSPSV
ncbi:unnamed protein product [Blepharisma stoltei]|uniref:Peptidase C1A papain C-terminal domain-containing protein n=1 Tax=Blepharisma stoltei TaxID=1481888 RepID=A0AAU9JN94_9CILI|nr:unnamed protein product [Blepharisma stoltei]